MAVNLLPYVQCSPIAAPRDLNAVFDNIDTLPGGISKVDF
jgi:hypothetical protein